MDTGKTLSFALGVSLPRVAIVWAISLVLVALGVVILAECMVNTSLFLHAVDFDLVFVGKAGEVDNVAPTNKILPVGHGIGTVESLGRIIDS